MSRWSVRPEWGIALLRIVVGVVFLAHGNQKLFTYGFAGVAQGLEKAGILLPGPSAVAVTLVELLCGIGLILGLLTRWSALLLAIVMSVAVLGVHLRGGFFLPMGFEYALTLLAANVSLMITGPGAFALDRVIGRARTFSPAAAVKKVA